MKTIWQVEIDEYCRRVLTRHFPDAERFNDVRECGAHNLKPVDVIAGGFPCQDISAAGRRVGITGERSGLWKEYHRIISEISPRFVVIENVSALLGNGMDVVLRDLSEIGYDAEWQVISAADVGAPHTRERVWIVAYPARNGWPGKLKARVGDRGGESRIQPESSRGCSVEQNRDVADSHGKPEGRLPIGETKEYAISCLGGEIMADTASLRQSGPRVLTEWCGTETDGEGEADWSFSMRFRSQWATEPDVGRVANGIPKRVDRLKGLGNAIVPQISEWIGKRIIEAAEIENQG